VALTTVATSVAGSAVALHSAGPTTVKLKNYGNETFTIGGSEVLFGITGDGSINVVVAIHP